MKLLVDNSVWQRISKPGVLTRLAEIGASSSIVTATPQALELLHSARNPAEHDELARRLSSFERLTIDDECHEIALSIQSALWHGGRVRGAGAFDIMIAAAAHRHGATVVHYDKNFQTIAAVVDGFRQHWIAPAGSLD